MTAAEHEFLDRSRLRHQSEQDALAAEARRQKQANRRLRRLLAGVAALLVVALVAGVIAVQQRSEATANGRESALRAVVADSLSLRRNQRDLAALLAVEAYRRAPRADTEAALFGTFTAAPGIGRTVQIQPGMHPMLVLPDGKTILLQDDDGGLHFVDFTTGAEQSRLDGTPARFDSSYTSPSLSADGRYLAHTVDEIGADEDSGYPLIVWDLQTREPRFGRVDVPFPVGTTSINGDGSLVAVGGGLDARVLLYDGKTGALLRELDRIPRPDGAKFQRSTAAVAFAPDGQLIVGSQTGVIRFVDAGTGRETRRIEGPPETSEARIQFSPDGLALLTGGFKGLMLYDLESGAAEWPAPAPFSCAGVAYAAIIGAYLCGSQDARVVTIDLATGAQVQGRFDTQKGGTSVEMMSDGVTLLEFGAGNTYTEWRLDGSGLISHLLPIQEHVLDYTADGRGLIVGPKGRDALGIDIIDPDTGEVVHHIPHAYIVKRTTDPNRLVGFFDDGTFGWYDLSRDARVGTAVKTDIDWFDFVVSGSRALVWPFDGSFSELDFDDGTVKPFGDPQAHTFQAMAAGPDRLITSLGTGGLVLRDSHTGAALAHADGVIYVGAAGIHIAVTGGPDGVSWVIDPDTLQKVGANFPSGGGGAGGEGLSDDERRLMLLAEDHTVRLLDVPSRTQLGDDIDVHATDGGGMRPDGLEMAAASDHGIVVWDLDPSHWITAACELAGRNLTREEWDHYLGELGSYRATCPEF